MTDTPSGYRLFRDEAGNPEDERFCSRAYRQQTLAREFPTLWHIAGIDPWDVQTLATKSILGVSTSTRQSILFLLSVWSPECPEHFALESFDVHSALKYWDTEHRSAFAAWARNPWWA